MKTKLFIFGIMAFALSVTVSSCSNDKAKEELQELDQLETLSLDKDEIKEEDT